MTSLVFFLKGKREKVISVKAVVAFFVVGCLFLFFFSPRGLHLNEPNFHIFIRDKTRTVNAKDSKQ